MLQDFWQLNASAAHKQLADYAALEACFSNSSDLRDASLTPGKIPPRVSLFRDKTFKNVSLGKATFVETTFTNCKFEDCIFISCEFIEVEFHDCLFVNCNFYKASFQRCYVDPAAFHFHKSLRGTAANVMLGLYSSIYANAQHMHQWKFSPRADIERRSWDLAQSMWRVRRIWNDDQIEFRTKARRIVGRLLSIGAGWLYGLTTRHGYGPVRFLTLSVAALLTASAVISNHWQFFGFSAPNGGDRFASATFYLVTVITTLGYSTYIPTTPKGQFISAAIGFAGVAWTAFFTALLIRRFVR